MRQFFIPRWSWFALFFFTVTADQTTKFFARVEPRGMIIHPRIFIFQNLANDKFFFWDIPQIVMIIASCVAILVISVAFIRSAHPPHLMTQVGICLVLAGAFSNLADRIVLGAVTDFLHIPFWSTFNIADIAIIGGTMLWLLSSVNDRPTPRADDAH